ncbi:unnamed protein product [Mucor hiemalis]
MSHFRCPSSSLVEEAGLYAYQPINGLDESQLFTEEEEDQLNSNMTSRTGSTANMTSLYESSSQRPVVTTSSSADSNKRCWICFGEDTDSEETHSLPLLLMGMMDSLVHTAAPYITVLGLGCSMLITSTTFGAYTVLTMFGTKEGERLIGNPAFWTWRTWLGLPAIPVALIASRLKWADNALPAAALLLLRLTGIKYPLQITWPPSPAVMFGLLPWVRLLYNNIYAIIQRRLSRTLLMRNDTQQQRIRRPLDVDNLNERSNEQDTEVLFGREGRDMSVTVIEALLWPSISSIIGGYLSHSKFVRRYFPETFQRNVLGGCLFVVAKDVASLIYRYERVRQRRSRRVVNYNDIKRRHK